MNTYVLYSDMYEFFNYYLTTLKNTCNVIKGDFVSWM